MKQEELSFTYKARYSTLGELNERTRQIWFVLHGYGQLAQYFIQKFRSLTEESIFVIAPEGLSRFYLEDVTSRMQSGNNRVGATWMTKENRATDIENYLQYLNALYHTIIPAANTIPVTILGFSQGAATASRWITEPAISFERLILWAGVFPPDINFETGKEVLRDKKTFMVYGTSDPFITDSRFAEMHTIASNLQVTPTIITFDGKHDIDTPTLRKFL